MAHTKSFEICAQFGGIGSTASATKRGSKQRMPNTMEVERDQWGFAVDQSERMQDAMLAFYDLLESTKNAEFSKEHIAELARVRLKFLDEFEQRHPGYGKGRAVWRWEGQDNA